MTTWRSARTSPPGRARAFVRTAVRKEMNTSKKRPSLNSRTNSLANLFFGGGQMLREMLTKRTDALPVTRESAKRVLRIYLTSINTRDKIWPCPPRLRVVSFFLAVVHPSYIPRMHVFAFNSSPPIFSRSFTLLLFLLYSTIIPRRLLARRALTL